MAQSGRIVRLIIGVVLGAMTCACSGSSGSGKNSAAGLSPTIAAAFTGDLCNVLTRAAAETVDARASEAQNFDLDPPYAPSCSRMEPIHAEGISIGQGVILAEMLPGFWGKDLGGLKTAASASAWVSQPFGSSSEASARLDGIGDIAVFKYDSVLHAWEVRWAVADVGYSLGVNASKSASKRVLALAKSLAKALGQN